MLACAHVLLIASSLAPFGGPSIGLNAPMTDAVPAQVELAEFAAAASVALGLEFTDDTALNALELFETDKFDDAIKSLDDVTNEKVNKDQERVRELKLMAGIILARSGTDKCIPKANERFNSVKKVIDKRGTSYKAEVAQDAVQWAVKDGQKGQNPDLKARDRWLRAIDGARQDYEKELNKKQPMLNAKIHDREFNGVRPYVEGTNKTMDLVVVIQHEREKSKAIGKKYAAWLREAAKETDFEIREIRGEISAKRAELGAVQGTTAAMNSKRRQIEEKIRSLEKKENDGDRARDFLRSEAGKYDK